jgi:RNase P subunit RPR2
MTRPATCGRCKGPLAAAPAEHERLDPTSQVIVGFLTCPGCGAHYVYQRAVTPDDRRASA